MLNDLDTSGTSSANGKLALGGIDCDVHVTIPTTKLLLPYLNDYWRDYVVVRGVDGLDLTSYPMGTPLMSRPDWRVDGVPPGSDLGRLQRDVLDPLGTKAAIINCVWGAQALFHPHLAAALCTAANDWLAKEWLDRDPRLRASIMVPWQDSSPCSCRDRAAQRGQAFRAGAVPMHGRYDAGPDPLLADL